MNDGFGVFLAIVLICVAFIGGFSFGEHLTKLNAVQNGVGEYYIGTNHYNKEFRWIKLDSSNK